MRISRFFNVRKTAAAAFVSAFMANGVHGQSCGQWIVAPNPIFNGVEFHPTLIAAFAPDSAVDVGGPPNTGGLVRTIWDGISWTPGPVESLNLSNAWDVRAVGGSGQNDLWISGIHVVDNFHSVPFIAHFDGQQWDAFEGNILEDPNPEGGDPIRSGEGSSIAVIAPDDIWVVGYGDSPDGSSSSPVTFHWDGSNLDEFVPQIQPVFSRNNNTKAVAAAASDYVWLVGYGRNSSSPTDPYFHMFTYHFDGSSWIPETDWTPLPGPASVQDFLDDVVAFAPNDAWAFGKKLVIINGVSQSVSFYLRWDGGGWTEVAGPDIGPITSASASGPNDIWVSNAFGEYGGRVAHWDGSSWAEMPSAPRPEATHIGLTNLASSPGADAWAVGYWAIYDGAGGWSVYENIVEHFLLICEGDVDGDGDVDAGDFAWLADCTTGPASATGLGCATTDLNLDGATDLSDFQVFQRAYWPAP